MLVVQKAAMGVDQWTERAANLLQTEGIKINAYKRLYHELTATYRPLIDLARETGVSIDFPGIAWRLLDKAMH